MAPAKTTQMKIRLEKYAALTSVLMLFALAGCQNGVDIDVAGQSGHPLFRFSNHNGGSRPCVTHVWVTKPDNTDHLSFMWSIDSGGQCVELTALEYGVAPKNFLTQNAAKPLQDGVLYNINASGDGFTRDVMFKFSGGGYHMYSLEEGSKMR